MKALSRAIPASTAGQGGRLIEGMLTPPREASGRLTEFVLRSTARRDPAFASSPARRLILAAQRTRFRGARAYSLEAFAARRDSRPFPPAERESRLFRDFFALFPSFDLVN